MPPPAADPILGLGLASALRAARRRLLPPPVLLSRPFHSHQHAPPSSPFSAVEEAILAAAYRHVPEHGFSSRALRLGARDAGLLDVSPAALPDGAFGLVRYHLVTQRLALAASRCRLFGDGPEHPDGQPRPSSPARRVAARVADLTWARLVGNEPVIHQWQQALAVMAQPTWLSASLKELALLSDEIWFLAGDEAVDSSWYSKRASLSMIYSTTELFMTNDQSPGFAETRQFLDRRLGEAETVGQAAASLGQWLGFTMNAGINVLRSKGVRI